MEILTMTEAAEFLKVSYEGLRVLLKTDNPPPYVWVGKSRRFIRTELLEWAKQNQGV